MRYGRQKIMMATENGASGALSTKLYATDFPRLMARSGGSDSLSTFVFACLWICICSYIVLYNNTESIASVLSLGTSLLFIMLLFLSSVYYMDFGIRVAFTVCLLVAINGILYLFNGSGDFSALIRYCISLTALGVFVSAKLNDLRALCSVGAGVVVVYAAVIAFISGPLTYSGTVRFAPFFAGETAVHSSSITMVALVIILWSAPWSLGRRIAFVSLGTILVLGYGVTTTILMLFIFFASCAFVHFGISLKWIWTLALIFVPIGAFWRDNTQVSGGGVSNLGIGALGSGRLTAWIERLQIFGESSWVAKLIGGGAYSDYRTTSLWWWSEKSAHSDFMTLLMEFGLVGLVIVLVFMTFLYREISPSGRMALLAVLMGATISNVLLDRPTVAMVWGVAIYAATRRDAFIAKHTVRSLTGCSP